MRARPSDRLVLGHAGRHRQEVGLQRVELPLAGNSALAEISVEALQGLLEKNGAYLGRDVN